MFSTRPPPPSGRPPQYAIVNRMTQRNLRPLVILFAILACVWALVWGVSSFRDIPDDQKNISGYVIFDIILGSLYMVVFVIEAYGVFAAWRSKIALVRIYAFLSLGTAILVIGIEIMTLVLHFNFKNQSINSCTNDLRGQSETIDTGSGFNRQSTTRPITPERAQDLCNDAFNTGTFHDIAWLLAALIAGFLFSAVTFAFYRQLLDPSAMRSQAPSAAYQMNATRNAFGYNNEIPGYNAYPSQSYGDYVPPYDNNKPPGYTSGPGYQNLHDGDEKAGYNAGGGGSRDIEAGKPSGNTNPFADSYSPPPGAPPPGFDHDRSKDEGFDTATLEAAMKQSERETKGPGGAVRRSDESAAGPSYK